MVSDQPKSFSTLIMVVMWESFSIYGLRALFTLYLGSELMFNDHKAYEVYGAFGALLYSLPFIGGWISDRGLGSRRSIIMGSLILILGFVVLSLPFQESFYGGIGMIICGYAFFKPNLSSLFGKLYYEKDPRRDAGFNWFFTASNLGAFIAPLLCGYVAYAYHWNYAFALASLGMIAGLLIFLKGCHQLAPYDPLILAQRTLHAGPLNVRHLIYGSLLPAIFIFSFLIKNSQWMSVLMPLAFSLVLLAVLRLAFQSSFRERANILVLLVLFGFILIFDVCFEQAWSSINFLIERAVVRTVYGFEIPTAWFLGINPLLVVLMGPLFSSLWLNLDRHKYHISVEVKFIIGMLALALGFVGLFIGTQLPNPQGFVHPWWVFLGYTFHTLGELCIIPVGLSMVSKLSPTSYTGTFMGLWCFIWAFSHYLGGHVAKLTAMTEVEDYCNLAKCRAIYGEVFLSMVVILVGLSLLLFLIRPYLRPTLRGVEG